MTKDTEVDARNDALGDNIRALLECIGRNSSKRDRNRNMIAHHMGLDGHGGASMEDAGRRYGLTREAVRQIRNRLTTEMRSALKNQSFPALHKAISIAHESAPVSADKLHKRLVDEGVVGHDAPRFHPHGLLRIAEVIQHPLGRYKTHSIDMGADVLTSICTARQVEDIAKMQTRMRDRTQHNGFGRLKDYRCFLQGVRRENKDAFIRSIAESFSGCHWIDDAREQFTFVNKNNRLLRRLKRVFSIVAQAHISDLAQSIERNYKKGAHDYTVAPDAKVIGQIIAATPGIDQSSEGLVMPTRIQPDPSLLQVMEARIIACIAFSDEGECREKELEDAVIDHERPKLGKFAYSMALNHSPLIMRKGRGRYTIVGPLRQDMADALYERAFADNASADAGGDV